MKDIGIFNIEKTQGIGKLPLNIEITLMWSKVVLGKVKAGSPSGIAVIWWVL